VPWVRAVSEAGRRVSACPRGAPPSFYAQVVLERVGARLLDQLSGLADRVERGEEAAWPDFLRAAEVLALLLPNLEPERRGRLLTTTEMAARLGIGTKGLLRRKARGEIQPALQRGKFIRWKGDEALGGNGGGNKRGKGSP